MSTEGGAGQRPRTQPGSILISGGYVYSQVMMLTKRLKKCRLRPRPATGVDDRQPRSLGRFCGKRGLERHVPLAASWVAFCVEHAGRPAPKMTPYALVRLRR